MKKNRLNLCDILKGHVGKVFYTTMYGNVTLKNIDGDTLIVTPCGCINGFLRVYSDGRISEQGEVVMFPSKDQRDWEEWFDNNDTEETYQDVWEHINDNYGHHTIQVHTCGIMASNKILAINRLMETRKYLEKDWLPSRNERCYCIYTDDDLDCRVDYIENPNSMDIYFSSEANARKAIEILGEESIRTALSTEW